MDIAFLNTLQVCDSLFPIGSYTLSNGLETFVQENKLQTCNDLKLYAENYISYMPYNELAFLSFIYKSLDKLELTTLKDNPQKQRLESKLIEIDTLYSAYKSAYEVRRGSMKLCQRFIKIWERIEEIPLLSLYKSLIQENKCDGHHLILFGLFTLSKKIDFRLSANMYAYNILSGIVTNAVKSVPLSQLDGQVILNSLLVSIQQAVEKSEKIDRDELGICGSAFDIYAMKHENLYSRVYMS